MSRRWLPALVACALVASVRQGAAQAAPVDPAAAGAPLTADDQCAAKAKLVNPQAAASAKRLNCDALADILWIALSDRFQEQINSANASPTAGVPLSMVQPKDNDSKGAQGSPAQAAAVPSVQPVANVGGTVAVAGTTTGTTVVSAVAINPFTLFGNPVLEPDPSRSHTYAQYSRFADVSLILPANISSTLPSGDVSFVGVRARVNLVGLQEGDKAYQAALAASRQTKTAYDAYQRRIGPVLRVAPNIAACADAIILQDDAAMTRSCGTDVTLSNTAAVAVHDALVAAAATADARYLGLDLRADFGDPTFSHDPMAGGTYILAAVAGGIQVSPNAAFRGRLGVAYAKLTKDPSASFAADYGAAAEINGGSAQRRVRISIGIEGRTGQQDMLADQHFLNLKLGLSIPVADGKSLGIGLTKPLAFEDQMSATKSTLLTISGDLGLLP